MCRSKFIVIAAVILIAATRVLALSTFIQATRINKEPMPFVINARSEGTNTLFRVVVDPQGGGVGTVLQSAASIDFYRAAKDVSQDNIMTGSHSPSPVSSRAVQPTKLPATMPGIKSSFGGKGVLYEFAVPTNDLDSSVFSVTYYVSGHPAFTRDWFILKDFAIQ